MLKVRDIMSPKLVTFEATASAEEAAWALTRRHIGGAPVLDGEGHLVGMLTKGDLVNPEPAQWIKGEPTIEDLMTPDVVAIHADEPARAAAEGMIQRDIHRIMVVDDDEKVIGIVSSTDIVRAVAAGLDFNVAAAA
jgi:CBS domain-containing protein